jgi:hypothetical protein
VGHYISNVRDIEFNLFEVLGLGSVLDSGGYGDLDVRNRAHHARRGRPAR